LSHTLSDIEIKELLSNNAFDKIELRVRSRYSFTDKRAYYQDVFQDPPGDLAQAIKRTVPKINIDEIYNIITSVPLMSDARKDYLNKAISIRYGQILSPAYKRI